MHYSLVKFSDGTSWAPDLFDDLMLPLYHALSHLGFLVECRINSLNKNSINILFGLSNYSAIDCDSIPRNSIIYNHEQVYSHAATHSADYLKLLSQLTVWDNSQRNIKYLCDSFGLTNVIEVPIGYVPEMTRLRDDFQQDIDILFYGKMSDRREKMIKQLYLAGYNVLVLKNTFGRERDLAIARSKMIVNIHYATPATLEMPRLGYLFANRKAVLSEFEPQTERPDRLEDAALYTSYEGIESAAAVLLKKHGLRSALSESAFNSFARISMEDILQKIVGRRGAYINFKPVPKCLQIGSGRDFRQNSLNVDISAACNPDIVLDISKPVDSQCTYQTKRFGPVCLQPGTFSRIIANDVLEHLSDLPQAMTNFLSLLEEGGDLDIFVPYELSLGAWRDPTHVRAFNEGSWIYYTDWAWYLGWRDYRFEKESITFLMTPEGAAMSEAGHSTDEILNTPRMAYAMHVILRKRAATEEEKTGYDLYYRNFYNGPLADWELPLGEEKAVKSSFIHKMDSN